MTEYSHECILVVIFRLLNLIRSEFALLWWVLLFPAFPQSQSDVGYQYLDRIQTSKI